MDTKLNSIKRSIIVGVMFGAFGILILVFRQDQIMLLTISCAFIFFFVVCFLMWTSAHKRRN